MLRHASLFSQVLSLIDRNHFARCVKDLEAEKHAKGFACWGQFVSMLFCQLAQAKSLREITQGLRSCEGKLRHLEHARVSMRGSDLETSFQPISTPLSLDDIYVA